VVHLRRWGLAVVARCLRRRSTVVVTGPLGGDGAGGCHTADPVSGESGPTSLAPTLGARVPVGRPRGPIRIRVVCLYDVLGGVDSDTGMTSIGSSSLSTTTATTNHLLPLR
jgi:hypothetical protein